MPARELEVDPFAAGTQYAALALLRQTDPVHRRDGIWLLTRHEHVDQVLRDHARFSSDEDSLQGLVNPGAPMINTDPPRHTQLRSLVIQTFTPRRIASQRQRIEQIVDGLLAAAVEREQFDVIADFGYPLAITVIAELLGIPPADWSQLRDWCRPLSRVFEPTLTDEERSTAARVQAELGAYLAALVHERRRVRQPDLISALIDAQESSQSLNDADLLTMLFLLLLAGHETTVNLIGNGVWSLLRHERAVGDLRAHRGFEATAIEELVRYEAPVGFIQRTARQDVQIGNKIVRANETVGCSLIAANRDPEVFADPDELRLSRVPNPHLGFGAGIHFCLGAPLARLEAEIAVPALVRRLSALHAVETPTWRNTVVFRGLAALHVSIR